MKKFVSFAVILITILCLFGCSSKTYELPHDQFCYSADRSQAVEMNVDDRKHIVDVLNNSSWVDSLTNCASDFIFYTQKQEVQYHSECGTFNDITNQRSVTVSDEERIIINSALGINQYN